jgi:hypothetical protein
MCYCLVTQPPVLLRVLITDSRCVVKERTDAANRAVSGDWSQSGVEPPHSKVR